MPTTIRTAGPDDAPAVHRLITALAEYEREPTAVESTPDVIRRQLADARPPFECLLAEDDGQVVGFALFFPTYSTWLGRQGLWLEDLFVLESHRHHGIGRALLTQVARLAVARGCGRLGVVEYSTGTSQRWPSTGRSAPSRSTPGRCTGSPARRCTPSRRRAERYSCASVSGEARSAPPDQWLVREPERLKDIPAPAARHGGRCSGDRGDGRCGGGVGESAALISS